MEQIPCKQMDTCNTPNGYIQNDLFQNSGLLFIYGLIIIWLRSTQFSLFPLSLWHIKQLPYSLLLEQNNGGINPSII